MTEQPAASLPEELNPHHISQAILDLQIRKIYGAAYSRFIPISSQDVERHKQVQRACARFFKRKEQINEAQKNV